MRSPWYVEPYPPESQCLLFKTPAHTLSQLSYGLGTARFKRGGPNEPLDENIIEATVTALRNGYYHLDCAEGILPPPFPA
jgi:hypothetical protein